MYSANWHIISRINWDQNELRMNVYLLLHIDGTLNYVCIRRQSKVSYNRLSSIHLQLFHGSQPSNFVQYIQKVFPPLLTNTLIYAIYLASCPLKPDILAHLQRLRRICIQCGDELKIYQVIHTYIYIQFTNIYNALFSYEYNIYQYS